MPKNKTFRYRIAISFLWQTIKPFKLLYFSASIISSFLVGIGLLQARTVQLLIDNAKGGSLQVILTSLIHFLLLIMVNVTLSFVSSLCVSRLAAKSGYNLKCKISDVLLHAKYGEIIKLQAGDTLQTVNSDTSIVCSFIGSDLIGLFSQFSMALGALVYVICVNPLLALVTFAYTPVGMFFTLSLNKKMNALYPIRADSEGRALSTVEQVLSSIPIIKSFMAEKQIREKVSIEYEAVYQTDMKISKWNALMQTACSSTSMIPRILYLIFAGYMVMNGHLSVGVLLSVFDLLSFIIGPTVYMPFLLNGLNRSTASMNRIAKLLALPQKKLSEVQEHCSNPSIKLNDISFSYTEGQSIISGLSFEFTGTGIIAISGKSGSGKTTLIDLIAGLYEPFKGNIETKGYISVVSQDTYLFDESIIENVRIAKLDATDDEVKHALALSGADNFAKDCNDFNDLSGGQKQRISLARTILSNAEIWLLDEPTSALDSETEDIILKTIKTFSKEKLILISAHRQSLISLAERRINL